MVEANFSRWSVAWICSFIFFLLLGVARLSGLLYLAAIDRYDADRSQASMPFVLCYTVRNVAGPLIGYMGRKVEIRLLTACGCFISALGAGACFFAEDITTVSVLWGGVFGIGFGLGSILLPEVLNQHFDKYISNANGIALGGECVAGFVLPVFVEFLLNTYGTSGTFLILSGLILHGVPAALLLKPPSKALHRSRVNQPGWSTDADGGEYSATTCVSGEGCNHGKISDTHAIENCNERVLNDSNHTDYQVDYLKADNSEVLEQSESDPLVQTRHGASLKVCRESSNVPTHYNKRHCHECLIASETVQQPASQINTNHCNSNHCYTTPTSFVHFKDNICTRNCAASSQKTQKSPEKQPSDQSSLHYSSSNHRSAINSSDIRTVSSNHLNDIQPTVHTTSDPNLIVTPYAYSITHSGSAPCTESANNPRESPGHPSPFRVFLDPTFLLILFTQSSMIFIFTTIMTIIIDFSRDAGVKSHQEVYILMCMSVSDMIGRFGLGWVTDAQYMGKISFSALCYGGTGLLMVALVFLRGFTMVMVVAFLIGLLLGGLLIVCPGIVIDFIEEDEVTMALASRFVLYAPMSLTQSLLIGFFREKLGSYNGLFYLLAVHCFICCTFSLSVPLASRYRDSRKEAKRFQTIENVCHNTTDR